MKAYVPEPIRTSHAHSAFPGQQEAKVDVAIRATGDMVARVGG